MVDRANSLREQEGAMLSYNLRLLTPRVGKSSTFPSKSKYLPPLCRISTTPLSMTKPPRCGVLQHREVYIGLTSGTALITSRHARFAAVVRDFAGAHAASSASLHCPLSTSCSSNVDGFVGSPFFTFEIDTKAAAGTCWCRA